MRCRQLLAGLVLCIAAAPSASAIVAVSRHAQKTVDVDSNTKNPIRKVVQLLQNLLKQVEKEGEKEKELYEKFSCYCMNGRADLETSISDNDAKVPALQSDIEEGESTVARLRQDLKQHQIDRDSANKAIQEATGLREKEHASFQKESTEMKGYVTALSRVIPAVEGGMAGTRLLQGENSAAAAQLRKAAGSDGQLTDDDRQTVVAFLDGGAVSSSSSGYVPSSGEVLGILKNMQADFEKDLAGVVATEEEAQKLYDELIAAKSKEVKSLGGSIERKTARVGELQVNIINMKHEISESEAMLISDQKFLKDLSTDCSGKDKEWEERQKVRSEEVLAIHETIKILNDDDALDLFKKALPSSSSSLVQLKKGREQVRQNALSAVRLSHGKDIQDHPEVRFLEMALMGKQVDFTKVIKMIDEMVALLGQEQADDEHKQEYCNKQLDHVDDKGKALKKSIGDLEVNIDERKETIGQLKSEIKDLKTGVAELDKLVLEATQQRKAQNEEFQELMSQNSAAKQLLEFAKNRLAKFYNPNQYQAPKKTETELTSEEEVGDLDLAASLLQKGSTTKNRADPGDAPGTWDKGYDKKGEETTGVVQMLDLLVRDLVKEMTEAEKDEESAQKMYEEMMNDSAAKRAKALRNLEIKESSKADSEVMNTNDEGDKRGATQELQATLIYHDQLHGECDWLLQNYDLRKSARADEVDNLKKAKAILSGADFSLLQAIPRTSLRGKRRA